MVTLFPKNKTREKGWDTSDYHFIQELPVTVAMGPNGHESHCVGMLILGGAQPETGFQKLPKGKRKEKVLHGGFILNSG